MDTEILQQIGINQSEIKVYLTLLDIGISTTGPIMNKAKVSASKVYGLLERLIEKGLVSFIIKGKTKYYQASSPEALLDYMDEKEKSLSSKKEKIKQIIPYLQVRHNEQKEKQEARIFLGWKGVQNAYNLILDILPRGSDFIGFVQPTKEEEEKSVQLFYMQYHRKRIRNRYNTKLISTNDLRDVFRKEPYSNFKNFNVRYVSHCPSGLVIFEDNILMIEFGKNPVAVLISSQQIAASYRNLFHKTWKNASK